MYNAMQMRFVITWGNSNDKATHHALQNSDVYCTEARQWHSRSHLEKRGSAIDVRKIPSYYQYINLWFIAFSYCMTKNLGPQWRLLLSREVSVEQAERLAIISAAQATGRWAKRCSRVEGYYRTREIDVADELRLVASRTQEAIYRAVFGSAPLRGPPATPLFAT